MRKNFLSHLKKLRFASIGIIVAFLSIASIILISATSVSASGNHDRTTSSQQRVLIGTATITNLQTNALKVQLSLQGTVANTGLSAYLQGTCSKQPSQSGFRLNDIQTDGTSTTTITNATNSLSSFSTSVPYIAVYNGNNGAGNQITNVACGKVSDPNPDNPSNPLTINLYGPATSASNNPTDGTTQYNAQGQQNSLGNAVLTLNNGTLDVSMSLTGLTQNGSYPAHIHKGTCENPSKSIKYHLNNVRDNNQDGNFTSVTDLKTKVQSIPNAKWYVTVHNDPNVAGNKNTIACGDILNPTGSNQLTVTLLAPVNTNVTGQNTVPVNTDVNTSPTTQNTDTTNVTNLSTMPMACPVFGTAQSPATTDGTTNTAAQTNFPCYTTSSVTTTNTGVTPFGNTTTNQSTSTCYTTGAALQNVGTTTTLLCNIQSNTQGSNQSLVTFACYNGTSQPAQSFGANQMIWSCPNSNTQPLQNGGIGTTTLQCSNAQTAQQGGTNFIPLACSFSAQTSTTLPTTFTAGANQAMMACNTNSAAFQAFQNSGSGTIALSCSASGSQTPQNGGATTSLVNINLSCSMGAQNDGTGTTKLQCSVGGSQQGSQGFQG